MVPLFLHSLVFITNDVTTDFQTNSAAMCFILAMALYPDVQKKAQAELDLHVGSKRLPTFEDYSILPYVRAIILECMRWHAAVPLGVSHYLIADDEYNGYRIPKGTTVIPVSLPPCSH